MTEAQLLNEYLKTKGKTITGQYIYRLIWSDEIYENRRGTFIDYTEKEHLFIREVTEVRRVRKYNYIHERWILETWAPGNVTRDPELPDAINGDYVILYVFEDRKGNYLPPVQKVLDFIINYRNGMVTQDDKIDPRYLEQKETEYLVESMDDHPNYFSTHGPARNAIAYTKGLKTI